MGSTKIAIVEDDSAIREMYAIKLKAAKYIVYSAADGLTGFDICKEHKPDLLLLDIRLPRLPGNEVLKRIRNTEWGKDIKVIILTNISKSEAPQDFRFLNISDYIVKAHYTPSQVLEIIKQVLS